jgi:hypothetical protein
MMHTTPDSMKFRKLQRRLGVPKVIVVGTLELLWLATQKNAKRGDIGRFTNEEIAIECEWELDPDELIEALVETGWLDRSKEHRLTVHDWPQHAPRYIHAWVKSQNTTFAVGDGIETTVGTVEATVVSTVEATSEGGIPNQTKPNKTQPNQTAADKVGRLVGGGEEVRSEVVDICNRIRKSSPRLDRELVWQATWVSLALDREVIVDFLERLKTRSIQKPDSYIKKAMRTLCEANAATWEDVRRVVPPAPEPAAKPRGSPVSEEASGVVFRQA